MTARNRQTVNLALNQLATSLGSPLQLSEEGVCALEFINGLECVIEVPDESPLLHLHGFIAQLPTTHTESFLRQALTLNLHGTKTKGAMLALDSKDRLILCYCAPIESITADGLAVLVTQFIEIAQSIRQELQQVTARAALSDPLDVLQGHLKVTDFDPLRHAFIRG